MGSHPVSIAVSLSLHFCIELVVLVGAGRGGQVRPCLGWAPSQQEDKPRPLRRRLAAKMVQPRKKLSRLLFDLKLCFSLLKSKSFLALIWNKRRAKTLF